MRVGMYRTEGIQVLLSRFTHKHLDVRHLATVRRIRAQEGPI